MASKPYIKIPTWKNGNWDYTEFATKEQFRDFVEKLFIGNIPGKYGFDETSLLFNEHARNFNKTGLFCEATEGSRDFLDYWDTEKEKCRKGVIFINGKKTWYLPRWYYHWVNFLQIYNKVNKKFMFPDVMDVQYHVSLYDILAALHGKHSAKLKKRQIAMSYYHIAMLYNRYIFEEGFVGKIMASDKAYIDATNGCWKFLEEYHNFTNTNTAWIRNNFPDKVFSWQQKLETKTYDGRKVDIGTRATITGVTLKEDPVKGVGGASDLAYYEEGGIAPTADTTFEFMKPAMQFGEESTGIFMISGSVGDLGQCKPLKDMIDNPHGNDIYPVYTDLIDESGTEGMRGLFIPEQWGRIPYVDQYGNSLVEKALDALNKEFEIAKTDKDPEKYQLMVSQHPRNIAEAFATRTVSKFPVRYTGPQERRILDNTYPIQHVELERNDKDEIVIKPSGRKPISDWPVKKTMEDKRGVVCIVKKPVKEDGRVPWGRYYGSLDPVNKGKTSSSDSLASIYIYENPIEVTRIDAEGNSETYIEGDNIVAYWCGRYDDINETNEQISKLVELYNAWTISEVGPFIQYMISKRRTKYLVPAKEMLFDKELGIEQKVFDSYGWTNSTKLWERMLEYGIDFLSEELRTIYKEDGTIERVVYGVERIPDIMLIKEMQSYEPKGNFDRIISYCALIAFSKIQQAAIGTRKRMEKKDDELTKTEKIPTLRGRELFHNIGRGSSMMGNVSMKRSAFKNIK